MIQRIQSIFLLDIFVISVLMVILPFGNYEVLFKSSGLSLSPQVDASTIKPLIWGPIFLNAFIAIYAVIVILGFKDRAKQIRNTRILMVLSAVLGVSLLLLDYTIEEVTLEMSWPAYLPFISMIFALLAGVFIKKDDDLVKSADRIR